MALYVKQLKFAEIIPVIRELALDFTPVSSFKVAGQGLSFVKTNTEITFGGQTYPISSFPKIYQLITAIQGVTGYTVVLSPDYYDLADTTTLINCNISDLTTEGTTINRSNYFPQSLIERYMEDFCRVYGYDVEDRFIDDVINNDFDYLDSKKICFWVAYWLLDVRRSSVALYGAMYSETSTGASSATVGVDTMRDVTVRVGEVFTITDRQQPASDAQKGFSALWGDKDTYWTRLQLYLRQQYEKLFNDFSLRDDVMRSSNFILEKNWSPFAHVDTFNLSANTRSLFI